MQKKIALATALAAVLLAVSCAPRYKCVENPFIESSNTMTIDISKVELTDTATILHTDAYFRPHYWIKISSESYLQTGGRKYALTGTRGIDADSLFWMPDSGEASFVLMFEPLPRGTRLFDFIESDCDECFKLFGIDLTGKRFNGVPEDIPAEAVRALETLPEELPSPQFKVGETVVHMHLSGYRRELAREAEIYLNTLLDGQQPYTAAIDPETGEAEFRFWQYGPAMALISVGTVNCTLWLAPGEQTDVYVDMRKTGRRIMSRRAMAKGLPQPEDTPSCYATGAYASLLSPSLTSDEYYGMNLYTGMFADYRMTAAEYAHHVVERYKSLSDSIAHSSLPEVGKELALLNLRQEAVVAIASGDMFREHNYRSVNNKWEPDESLDVRIDPLTAADRAELCSLFDVTDPKLFMGSMMSEYVMAFANDGIAWPEEAGIENSFVPDLRTALGLVLQAYGAELTDEDVKALDGIRDPFYREALLKMHENALARLKELDARAVVEPTPDVAVEKLFDAIIAPYKGKVILVDFWNTWCVPCRMAIKAVEPMKSDELKSDDMVWIYIANETSPIVKYKEMIPDIEGKHFRLNYKQWMYLCEKFGIDGIPSYVVVDRSGMYSLRNDLRDHEKMRDELKRMLELE